ncbi:MAG: hypothetical protein ACK5MA_05160 [Parachlamydiaceae bacterium]
MPRSNNPHEDFELHHSENQAGYVLITCAQPTNGGEMKVEMTYGGSPCLAHMLIDGAQTILEEAVEQEAENDPFLD